MVAMARQASILFIIYFSLSAIVVAIAFPLLTDPTATPPPRKFPLPFPVQRPRLPVPGAAPLNNATTTAPRIPKLRRGTPDAREFLLEHNKVRDMFKLPRLTWDKKLARFARRYANERKSDCEMIHSDTQEYGENIFWGKFYEMHTPGEAVRAWAGESKIYNLKTATCSDGDKCGHFTQLIWKTTEKVGCSRVKCDTGGVFAVCEYFPAGNILNGNPLVG